MSLNDPIFARQFQEFKWTAFRLETLQSYAVEYERVDYRRFITGRPRRVPSGIGPWVEQVAAGTAMGKRFQRVHLVRKPLTDYIRFECAWSYRDAVSAGEDVRIVPLDEESWPPELPRDDFWLFDARRLVALAYGPDGSFDWGEVTDSPERVRAAIAWRDRAVQMSVPFGEFARSFDDLMFEQSA
ncbi:MAG TPA: hypothetical protein VMU51_25990 [Mycobacteriales bacterium]|nr:hypothetical protein [Mycobacteriales bacterium]